MNAHAEIPPRPEIRPFTDLPKIPAIVRLQGRDQWLCWDYQWKPERKKWDKPPLNPNTGGAGSSTDPASWSSYDQAALKTVKSGFAGVGFALTPEDDTTGIDLDKCRNKETGNLDLWAAEIVGFGETYAEVSPSGEGIRLFAEGKCEATFKFDPARVEVYVGGRYLTVTGHHLPGTPKEIRPAPRTIEALRNRVETIRAKIEREKATEHRQAEPRKPGAGGNFWRNVNDAALANLASWVPSLFGPAARYAPGTRAYRITSRSLRRDLEEDLSITPGGIVDFGIADMGDRRDGKRTAIDLVQEHGGHARAADAALWLCDRLGIAPESLGWNAREKKQEQPHAEEPKEQPKGPLVLFYGDAEPEPPPYLIDRLLPQTQTAILAGQFSAGKTFIAIDIALSVMLGLDFAGRKTMRTGAVIWLAAEGANEVDVRLKAAALHRTGEDQKGKLPFCRQAYAVPTLTEPEAFDSLMKIVNAAKAVLAERFTGTEIAMIVVDTLNSAAGFADQNDGAEAQRVMKLCRRVSDETGSLVLLVDHFGKLVETNIKGSSDKGNASDAILSALADKAMDGSISNRRMALFKLRNGPTGSTTPFNLVSVPINEWGTTSCALEWNEVPEDVAPKSGEKPPKADWTGNSRIFRAALLDVLLDTKHAVKQRPFGFDTAEINCAPSKRVRDEFYARYPADSQEAKKKQFNRELKNAIAKHLIQSREIGGVDWLWFLKQADEVEVAMSAQMKRSDNRV